MSVKLSRIRARTQIKLNATDARNTVLDIVKIDQECAEAYIALQSFLPAPTLYTASGLTIAAGSETFTLPTAAPVGWTGNDGGSEYKGDVRIRLQSTGSFIRKKTNEEFDAWRSGQVNLYPGRPELFALYEDAGQVVRGRCYPAAKDVEVCDLWASMAVKDLRDYVGAGTENLDNVEAELSVEATGALVGLTASRLLAATSEKKADELGLDKSVAAQWHKEAWDLAYGDAMRRHNLDDTSDAQRRVS